MNYEGGIIRLRFFVTTPHSPILPLHLLPVCHVIYLILLITNNSMDNIIISSFQLMRTKQQEFV